MSIEASKQWEGQSVRGAFDSYELGRPLGGSESSAVFQTGRGAQKDEKAAIKLVPCDAAEAELRLSRWKLTEKLSHPNLLRIFDMGRCRIGDSDLVFVVTEFADEDLSQILPERPLTVAEAGDMLKPVLDAVLFLHQQNFVHGHIRPANIMAVQNQVKLSSDGVLRAGAIDSGAGLGPYDPPENAVRGNLARPAGDIWSLGMTLAEVLTQRLPLPAAGSEGDPALPASLTNPFADIVRQCLRRDPRVRPTISQIAARLQPPDAAPKEPVDAASSSRRWIVPTIAAVLVVAIAGGWKMVHSGSGEGEDPSVAIADRRAETPKSQNPAMSMRDQKAPAQSKTPPAQPRMSAWRGEGPVSAETGRNGAVHQVIPNVSQRALDTIQGRIKVSVRVRVDGAGKVTGAELETHGSSKYFARQAVEASWGWKFVPAQDAAERAWSLQFEFTNSQTKAIAERAAP